MLVGYIFNSLIIKLFPILDVQEKQADEYKKKIQKIISISQKWILPLVGVIFTASMWILGLINHYSYQSKC